METLTLKRPVKLADGRQLTTITLRECTVADVKQAQRMTKGDNGALEIALLGVSCDLLPEDFERLSLSDYMRIQTRFQQLIADDTDKTTQENAGSVS